MFFLQSGLKAQEVVIPRKKIYKNSNKLRQRVESPKAGNTVFFDAGTSQQDGK